MDKSSGEASVVPWENGDAVVKSECPDSELTTGDARNTQTEPIKTETNSQASRDKSMSREAAVIKDPVGTASVNSRIVPKETTLSKRLICEMECSSEEEEFAGFDEELLKRDNPRNKKIKMEIQSDDDEKFNEKSFTDDFQDESGDGHGMSETDRNDIDLNSSFGSKSRSNRGSVLPITDPIYRKPFTYGWRRELVYRAFPGSSKEKGEVYYIIPSGKKLRTRTEIQMNLHDGLTLANFTLAKEPIGMGPDEEIIRSAKTNAATMRRSNVDSPLFDTPILSLGKRMSKSKHSMSPKQSLSSGVSSKKLSTIKPKSDENRLGSIYPSGTKSGTPKITKSKGEPCTIQCVRAMGIIPQLQCKKCLCLFHHECVALDKYTAIKKYTCEACLAEPVLPPPSTQSSSTNSSLSNTTAQNSLTSTTTAPTSSPPPPPSSTSALTSTSNTAVPIQGYPPTGQTKRSSSASLDQPDNPVAGKLRNNRHDYSSSLATTTIINNADGAAASENQPQTIATVAGRKFIVVPKTNVLSFVGGDNQTATLATGAAAPSPLNGQLSLTIGHESRRHRSSGSRGGSVGGGRIQSPSLTDSAEPLLKRTASAAAATNASAQKDEISDHQQQQQQQPDLSDNMMMLVGDVPTTAAAPSSKTSTIKTTRRLTNTSLSLGMAGSGGGKMSGNITGHLSHFNFSTHFFSNVSIGYVVLMETFQYLKVQELLRASCVCKMWNQVANHPALWTTVRMKNSQVNDWTGLANTLKRNRTKYIDLRKMLIPKDENEMWTNFSANIGIADNLEKIELCKCSWTVIENLFDSNQQLRVVNALKIRDDQIDIRKVSNLTKLTELRLKGTISLTLTTNLEPLGQLQNLRHLSLTNVKQLGTNSIAVLANLTALRSLELGECSEFDTTLSDNVLPKLVNLVRLRLEKGQQQCPTFDILRAVSQLKNLKQLELVNFDIKSEFDEHIAKCVHLQKMLIIPTYISQSATTNNMVLSGMLKISATLKYAVWVVTLELLRVTELYVDQCEREMKLPGDSIPVLKPVPGMSEEDRSAKSFSDVPQVEILPLNKVEKILNGMVPTTVVKIVKVPYQMTWRQTLDS